MAKLLKLRRGTTTQHGSFTGAEGEVTVDTDKETLVVHDGSTAGGHPVAAEDMANVSSASIAGRLAADSIATSKIAAGALPTDVTVASANIVDGTISTADIANNAVTTAKIADAQVTTAKIAGSAVTRTTIANAAISSDKIDTGQVTTAKLGDLAVSTAKLGDTAVTTAKIADNAVTSAKIAQGTITNGNVNTGAAIAGTKVSPDFGSQSIVTTGNILLNGDSTGASNHRLTFGSQSGGDLAIYHDGNNSRIAESGTGHLIITSNGAGVLIQDHSSGNNMAKFFNGAQSELYHNYSKKFETLSDGAKVTGNLDVSNGADITGNVTVSGTVNSGSQTVTGNITVSGTVDGVDVAVRDTLFGSVVTSSGSLGNGVVATTQSASDNSAKVATTAYVDTAVSNLVDSSPAALNTLNELAAAINDDANFSTTVTNSIATKMPLSGGTFTGAVTGTTIADGKGNLRSIPKQAKTSGYAAVASDAGQCIFISSGGVTINNSVFSAGDAISIVNNSGSSQTIYQGSGMTMYNTADAATGNRTLAGRGMCTIWFSAASQSYISGAGLE
tara:strand:+ start:651 stop:2327 length:1677 start_codon:yes stop_codon:yes gene_type:complete